MRQPSLDRGTRTILLGLVVSLAMSLVGAGGPSIGLAADVGPAPSSSGAAAASVEPSADPSEPAASGAPPASADPSASAAPPADASPSVAPSLAPPPSVTPSSSAAGPLPLASSLPSPSASVAPSIAASPAPSAAVLQPPADPPPVPTWCNGWTAHQRRADELLVNRWQYPQHSAVTLASDRSWKEDPFASRNWQFLDHTLQSTVSLFHAYAETDDPRYRDRASAILQDWIADNPRIGSPSVWSWNDHSTAFRAVVLVCATLYLPRDPWLEGAIQLHGATLADPAFYYRPGGNHALNQMIALIEVANLLGRSDWTTYALSRMSALATAGIDAQGVTNEQSVQYQWYNFDRYSFARQRLVQLGLTPPASFSRVGLMPRFLAYATLPNGQYEMLGDTDRLVAKPISGTWAEFAATSGASGPKPPDTVALYSAGYLFARTGWGEKRAFADEVAVSLRFGPRRFMHGHDDHGSLSVYGAGSRLLIDPGKFTYNVDPYRTWFVGRTAHNVVTADKLAWKSTVASDLLNYSRNATMVATRVRLLGYTGVSQVRGVTFSRNLGYVIVDDRVSSSTWRTYRQLWHLTEDAAPYVQPWHFRTQRARGNVQVRQLNTTGATSRVLTGRTSPIQGWLAWEFGKRVAAPTVEVIRSGTNVRFLTLIVTAPGTPSSGVSELKLTSTGYSVVVKIGAKRERVVVNGSTVTITALP